MKKVIKTQMDFYMSQQREDEKVQAGKDKEIFDDFNNKPSLSSPLTVAL